MSRRSQKPISTSLVVIILNELLVVVRGPDRIRVLSRVCLHRWAPVCEGRGNTKLFSCPFHRWAYSIDGRLVATPLMEPNDKFDPKSCSLPEVRSEVARIAREAPAISGRGIMLAAVADGTTGVAARLIGKYERDSSPDIVFTGYVPPGTPAERLTNSGRGAFIRWNVHPRFSDNVALARATGARVVVPAFGGPKQPGEWQQAFAPAQVMLEHLIEL